jgi:response regulator NasT
VCTLIVQTEGRKRAWINALASSAAWHDRCSRAYLNMSEPSLRILLVDQNADRAAILEEGLREAGLRDITVVRETQSLLRRIVDLDPDVIFIDLENPNRDVLEQMFQVSRSVRRPIAMFVDQASTETIRAAIESGVGAYVVDGLRKERVKTILDTAVSHFNTFNRLRDELERANQQLEERKLIERAKGILMKEREVSESDAYALLRTAAMNENRRIVDVARSVVSTIRLLK